MGQRMRPENSKKEHNARAVEGCAGSHGTPARDIGLDLRYSKRRFAAVIKTKGLAHISVYVADLERATRFYQQGFGLEILREHRLRIGADPDGRQISLSTPGQNDIITLMQAKGAPVGPGGLSHFAFILNDDSQLDAAITEVEHAGGKLIQRLPYEEDGI